MDDKAGVAIFPPLLLAICIAFGWIASRVLPVQQIAVILAVPLAIICAVAGLFLDRSAQSALRHASTAIHPSQATRVIVTTGPFAISRNPIYVGQGLLLLAGGFLAQELAYFIACVPWYLAMRYGVIGREERYLAGKFGAAYVDYMSTVRRWL